MNELTPLREAREWVRDGARSGGVLCPCCGQRAQEYRRPLNASMTRSLVLMYAKAGTEWINVPADVGARSREEGKLRYWGLITEDGAAGAHTGWWRVTERGAAFVRKELLVLKFAVIYDQTLLRLEGPYVGVRECLNTKFNLEQLLADHTGEPPVREDEETD